jgi:hypothetical protein
MTRWIPLCAICILLALAPGNAELRTVSPDEAARWIRHTVPLPKSIVINGKTSVPRGEVALRYDGSDQVSVQACRELKEIFRSNRRQRSPHGMAIRRMEKTAFCVALQLGGPDAEPLRKLRNSDQAYLIIPSANDKGLRLVALSPRGLYYAAKTLQQLVRAKSSADTAVIPIMRVKDWPDMEDRGLWGCDAYLHSAWLAERKMNYCEQIAIVGVDEQGKPHAEPKPVNAPMIKDGPPRGINFVPVVLHLEQLLSRIVKSYPRLQGTGGAESAICYSQPEFTDLLAEWIAQLGRVPGVREVDVWMTENLQQQGGCTCPECSKTDRSVLEARTILAAWNKAKEKVPGLGLRILTSEETENSNKLVFRELPPDVKVWYYHSLLTYNTGQTPILWRKYLADFARSGRWLGVCPNLGNAVNFVCPFTGADFVRYRMREFVDKRVSGLIGYPSPEIKYYRFNVEAAAEWSWNSKGRSPHEFALSWAVREGLKDPEKFAEWSELVGPVEWDIYGSEWPAGEQRNVPGHVADLLKEGRLPRLGDVLWEAFRVPFGDIKTPWQLDRDVANAEKAVRLAEEMGIPELVHESLIAQGYINSLKALYELGKIVKPDGIALENREAARRWFETYDRSLKQVTDELPKWEAIVTEGSDNRHFTDVPVKVITEIIAQMDEVAVGIGVEPKRE